MSHTRRLLAGTVTLWRTLGEYLRPGRGYARGPVTDRASLALFLDTRASYVAQTSLYGYLRTRAGMRYPELFSDDAFVVSINIAKWNLWVACLSDLSVYAGGLLTRARPAAARDVGSLMRGVVDGVLDETGIPTDAGGDFPQHVERLRARIACCDWAAVSDDEGPFVESPGALVRFAPIIDELKALDEPIVRNSVRFRWQEVRRDLRVSLDAAAVLSAPGARAPAQAPHDA